MRLPIEANRIEPTPRVAASSCDLPKDRDFTPPKTNAQRSIQLLTIVTNLIIREPSVSVPSLRKHRAICVFALVSSLAGLARAQTSGLDLHTALQTAQAANLELRAARQNRAIALAGITVSRAIPNPSLSFSAARDTPHESVVFDLPLELGGKRGKRVAVATAEQAATEVDVSVLERNVRRRTREAFFRSLAAQQQTTQAKAALDLSARIKDIVKQRFDAGDVAQLEVIQADVEFARAEGDYEMAQQAQKSADVLLAALLNRKFDSALALQGNLDVVPPAPSMDVAIDTALHSNPDVQKFSQQYAIEQRRLQLAKAMRIPNLDLQGGVDLNSPPDFQAGGRGQIGVTIPLFYRGQGEVAQSHAKLELLHLTLQSEQIMVSAEVAAAYFDYTAKLRFADRYS